MGVFSRAIGNPYVKYGIAPGAVGASAGAGYSAYSNYADNTNYNLTNSALLGAGVGLGLASPFAFTGGVARDYNMYKSTLKSVGMDSSINPKGFAAARRLL